MPGMDGFEVAETMSGYSKVRDTPIIFLSAVNKDKRFVTQGYLSGGIDYITKPVDPDILILKVKTFHKLYEQQTQLRLSEETLRKEMVIRIEAQEALAIVNDTLEQKVLGRTKELKEKNKILEDMNHELQQFTWVVSHDLIEPLRKIQAFNGIIKDRYLNNQEEGMAYLQRSINASTRMSDLIRDLLEYSRLTVKSEFKPTDLRLLITDLLEDFDHTVKNKNASLLIGDLPTIDSIPGQMRQVFQNLIGNALKFTVKERNPVLSVTHEFIKEKSFDSPVDPGGEFCRISISDNGIGFDTKYLDKIFIIFQRLQKIEDFEGTGIGLAIAKKIIDKHNGLITARSIENEGTTFVLVLPRAQSNL